MAEKGAGAHVALLRGINLGSRAKVRMDDLRRLFVDLGAVDPTTYLQTGNVVFRAGDGGEPPPAEAIERRIARDLGLEITVLLRTAGEFAAVVASNPFPAAGADPKRLHVTFLAARPAGDRAGAVEGARDDVDELALVGREVYLHCPNGYGRTQFSNAWLERRLAVRATTRTWGTVTKLGALLEG